MIHTNAMVASSGIYHGPVSTPAPAVQPEPERDPIFDLFDGDLEPPPAVEAEPAAQQQQYTAPQAAPPPQRPAEDPFTNELDVPAFLRRGRRMFQ